MKIESFQIYNAFRGLKQSKVAPLITPSMLAHSAAMMGAIQTFHSLLFADKVEFFFDVEGKVGPTPVSYISQCKENQGRDFFRIFPASLVESVDGYRRSIYRIMRNGEGGVEYGPTNPKYRRIDAIISYAAHEVRHKAQELMMLKPFTPDILELRRAFLGVSLDIRKMHYKDCPEFYSLSGENNIMREFDAETIAMYVANLWESKAPEEIAKMLMAEPD